MDTRTIGPAAEEYLRIREALLHDYPELADDIETLADTLDGLTSAQDIVRSLVRGSIADKAAAYAVGGLIDDYTARKHRLEDRAERRREAALRLMQRMEVRKITAPEATISVRAVPPKLDVYDEGALPETAWDYKTVRQLNKVRVKASLEAGEAVPGARLTNGGECINVRS